MIIFVNYGVFNKSKKINIEVSKREKYIFRAKETVQVLRHLSSMPLTQVQSLTQHMVILAHGELFLGTELRVSPAYYFHVWHNKSQNQNQTNIHNNLGPRGRRTDSMCPISNTLSITGCTPRDPEHSGCGSAGPYLSGWPV